MTPSTTTPLTFAQLGLAEPILRALTDKKYLTPSPIQAEAIPHLLAGKDLMGSAQTGTGKTAAFALPILQRLSASLLPRTPRSPRALILTPTRELAVQIATSFADYGKYLQLRHVVIYGGVGQGPQVYALTKGVDIAIATPGRLLDLAQQGHVKFDKVEIFVLDEADRMLDMGFTPDVKRILAKVPEQRQSLLFSATVPASIQELASRILRKPVRVEMTPEKPTVERITQRVCEVAQGDKYTLLRHILDQNPDGLVLVFSRTKHGAKKLARNLSAAGYPAGEIHGNKSQSQRQNALETFRSGRTRILVATDVAARGIDVKGIAMVVNYDIPNEPEAYVHRIGRTARAGAEGLAFSFCDRSERNYLRGIQRLIRQNIPIYTDHPFAKGGTGHGTTEHTYRSPLAHREATQAQRKAPASRPSVTHRAPLAQRPESSHTTEGHRPAEHRPAPHRGTEHRPSEHRPAAHRPAAHREVEHRPAVHHRPAASHRPVESFDRPVVHHRSADTHRPSHAAPRPSHGEHRPSHAAPRAAHAEPRPAHASRPAHAPERPTHAPRPAARHEAPHAPASAARSGYSNHSSPFQRNQARQHRGAPGRGRGTSQSW